MEDLADTLIYYEDVPETHWAYNNINSIAHLGWVTDIGGNRFEPDRYITRAEAVTWVNRWQERYPDKEFIRNNYELMVRFEDIWGYWAYYKIMEAAYTHEYINNSAGEIWM